MKKVKMSLAGLAIVAAVTMSFSTVGDFAIVDPSHPDYQTSGLSQTQAEDLCPNAGFLCAENENQSVQIEWDGIATKF